MTQEEVQKYIEENCPKWLRDKSIGDWFDWDKSKQTNFNDLLGKITLHDSYWLGQICNADNTINLIFNFDSFWNTKISDKNSCRINEWPYLIIQVDKLFNLFSDSNMEIGSTIANARTTRISSADIENAISKFENQNIINLKLLENLIGKQVDKTTIEDVGGGLIELLHEEKICVLLYDSNGSLIDLTDKI